MLIPLQFISVHQGLATSRQDPLTSTGNGTKHGPKKPDMTLKAASLKTMKRGRHPDGRYGLYFNVIGNSRTWVQRLTIDGKRRNFGLGPWPVVSLSEAREIAFDNVRKRHRGIDPIAERSRAAAMPTFAEALDSCIALRADGWKAGSRNEANWRSSLAHAAPLANRAVDAIASDDVVGIVTALLRAGKAPSARSVRQRIRLVFDWCIAQGHRTDNPANDAIDALLPSSGHKTKHRESVAMGDVAQVVAKIETTAHASRLRGGDGAALPRPERRAHVGSDRGAVERDRP